MSGKLSDSKVLFVCDHVLDPRLGRKVRWLNEAVRDLLVIRDSSRSAHGAETNVQGVEYVEYDEFAARISDCHDALIYVAGNKTLRDHFRLLRNAAKTNTIIWEVADLPLRAGFPRDLLTAAVYRFYLSRLNPNFVVTAPGFMNWLPRKKPWLLMENIPDISLANDLSAMDCPDTSGRLRIGFPGVIRFLGPLVMLHRYGCEHPDAFEIHIWGGAESAWEELKRQCMADVGRVSNLHYHGRYELNKDAVNIYSDIDVVWAVYDTRQSNVKVALPNRMYEAILAGRWVFASQNTEVARRVIELSAGYELPSLSTQYEAFSTALSAAIRDLRKRQFPIAAREEIMRLTRESKQLFLDYVESVLTKSARR